MPELPPPPSDVRPAAPWAALVARRSQLVSVWPIVAGAVALVVIAAVGWAAWRGPVSGAQAPELVMPRADPANDPAGDLSSAQAGEARVVTHIAGAVAHPGVYRLAGGARVADALDAAGGPTADADVDALNLAAKVADGERVYVPRRGETPAPAAGAGGPGATDAGPLDLNAATAEQLDALPGVGPATAAAIIDYRTERGRFRSVDELLEVRGIGEAKLASLRTKVRVR